MIHDNTASERNFLGCLLRSPHEFWQINEIVSADQFAIPHHRDIFNAIRDLSERGKVVSITTLCANLPEEFEGAGPAIGVLMALRESAADAGSASDYAPFLAERAALKRLTALSKWMEKESGKNERNAEEIAAEASAKLHAIMATAAPLKPVRLGEITKRVASFSNEANSTEKMPGFTTGLTALDEMTGLLMGGDFIGIIGALGDGKSSLLSQIGKHISHRAPVLYCSNEMGEEQTGSRFLAGESGMSVREIREGAYDFVGAEAVKEAQARLEALQYHVYTDPR